MADNLQSKGPQDSSRVNINESYEVTYWTKKFNVSEMELITAVKEVGVSAEKLKAHFAKKTH